MLDDFPGAGLLDTPAGLDDEVQRLAHEAGALCGTDRRAALALQQRAYALLPERRTAYYDAIWLLRDIGESQFRLGMYAEGKATLTLAVREVAGAVRLADVRMHLGQCMYELGEPGSGDWLAAAYTLGGPDVYRHEDPKYVVHARRVHDAAPRGQPAGWWPDAEPGAAADGSGPTGLSWVRASAGRCRR